MLLSLHRQCARAKTFSHFEMCVVGFETSTERALALSFSLSLPPSLVRRARSIYLSLKFRQKKKKENKMRKLGEKCMYIHRYRHTPLTHRPSSYRVRCARIPYRYTTAHLYLPFIPRSVVFVSACVIGISLYPSCALSLSRFHALHGRRRLYRIFSFVILERNASVLFLIFCTKLSPVHAQRIPNHNPSILFSIFFVVLYLYLFRLQRNRNLLSLH